MQQFLMWTPRDTTGLMVAALALVVLTPLAVWMWWAERHGWKRYVPPASPQRYGLLRLVDVAAGRLYEAYRKAAAEVATENDLPDPPWELLPEAIQRPWFAVEAAAVQAVVSQAPISIITHQDFERLTTEVRRLTLRGLASALARNWSRSIWWGLQRAAARAGFLDVRSGDYLANGRWQWRFWAPRSKLDEIISVKITPMPPSSWSGPAQVLSDVPPSPEMASRFKSADTPEKLGELLASMRSPFTDQGQEALERSGAFIPGSVDIQVHPGQTEAEKVGRVLSMTVNWTPPGLDQEALKRFAQEHAAADFMLDEGGRVPGFSIGELEMMLRVAISRRGEMMDANHLIPRVERLLAQANQDGIKHGPVDVATPGAGITAETGIPFAQHAAEMEKLRASEAVLVAADEWERSTMWEGPLAVKLAASVRALREIRPAEANGGVQFKLGLSPEWDGLRLQRVPDVFKDNPAITVHGVKRGADGGAEATATLHGSIEPIPVAAEEEHGGKVVGTGISLTEEEVNELRDIASQPFIIVNGREPETVEAALYRIALRKGLPEISGYYGLDQQKSPPEVTKWEAAGSWHCPECGATGPTLTTSPTLERHMEICPNRAGGVR